MAKYVLLLGVICLVFWLLRRGAKSGSGKLHENTHSSAHSSAHSANDGAEASDQSERMVKCGHCGVNQPISESILTQGRYYCSPEHRQIAESSKT